MYVIEECHNVPIEIQQVLKKYVKHHGFIAGGAARWAVMGDSAPLPSDIDIFAKEHYPWNYIYDRLSTAFSGKRIMSANAYTWKVDGRMDIQLVSMVNRKRLVGAVETILDEFSLTTEQFAVYYQDKKFWACYSQQGLEDTANMIMRINRMTLDTVVATGERLFKYAGKGYKVADGEVEKIVKSWGKLTKEQRAEAVKYKEYGSPPNSGEIAEAVWPGLADFVVQAKAVAVDKSSLYKQMVVQLQNNLKTYQEATAYKWTSPIAPGQLKPAIVEGTIFVGDNTNMIASDGTKIVIYDGTNI